MSQVLLQQQRDEWALARDEEAAILRKQSDAQLEESNRLGVTAAAQEASQSRIDAQAAQLKSDAEKLAAENAQVRADIEKERVESERVLHNERQTHFEDLQARQADLVRRQSITEEKIRQQEQEWAERQRQIEHDLNASRMLHQRKLDKLAGDWDATAKSKREELEQEEQTLQDVRAELRREKARHQAELDEATRKLASDRHLIQDGLTQMDAQLNLLQQHTLTNQRIAFLLSMNPSKLRLAGSNTSGDALISLTQGSNVATFNNYRSVSAESLLALTPDIIVIAGRDADSAVDEVLAANPILKYTPAGKNGNILAVDGNTLITGLSPAAIDEALALVKRVKNTAISVTSALP